jgi:ribonuclease Z
MLQKLAIPGLPVNCQPITTGFTNLLRPYAPPTISPDVVAKDRFHPVIKGEQTFGISSELQQRMEAVRNEISQSIEQRENSVVPGAEVGLFIFVPTVLTKWFIFLSVVDAHSDTILW